MYIAVFGGFLALRSASSGFSGQRTNDVMDNSCHQCENRACRSEPRRGLFSTEDHQLGVQVNEVQIVAVL